MQSLKNKLTHKNTNTTTTTGEKKHHLFGHKNTSTTPNTVVNTGPAPAYAVRETQAAASTLPHGSTVERIEKQRTTTVDDHLGAPISNTETDVTLIKHIPIAPAAPAVWAPERADHFDWHKYDNWDRFTWSRGVGFTGLNSSSSFGSFNSASSFNSSTSSIRSETLPTQIFEKPTVVHEEIRREQIEEIQPVINIEKLKTEVHQVTQPLFDKEVKPVNMEQRTLATEILPEVILPGRGVSRAADYSTVRVQDTAAVVVEKPAIYNEVDKLQVIEEIQPVLYKETVVPTLIQETKPVYQKIVEGANYSQETLAARDISVPSNNRGYIAPDMTPQAPTLLMENLPAQVMEKPVIIHEEVRREQVEEIQPVINIEKMKTEVHQVTQPLFDKEIKAVNLQQRILAPEVLPEIILPGRGVSMSAAIGSVHYQDSEARVIEKPALITEIDKLQVIEEIQPVIYKETIIPTVIQETKPVYQKIVEGAVYIQQTLAPVDVSSTQYRHLHTSTWSESSFSSDMSGLNLGSQMNTGYATPMNIPIADGNSLGYAEKMRVNQPGQFVETKQTTTTTTTTNQPNLPTYAL